MNLNVHIAERHLNRGMETDATLAKKELCVNKENLKFEPEKSEDIEELRYWYSVSQDALTETMKASAQKDAEIERLKGELTRKHEIISAFQEEKARWLDDRQQLEQATRWRDIESAPKDGKLFLAHNDGMDYDIVSWDGHRFTDYQYDRYSFKRWLPLPPAPNGEE